MRGMSVPIAFEEILIPCRASSCSAALDGAAGSSGYACDEASLSPLRQNVQAWGLARRQLEESWLEEGAGAKVAQEYCPSG